MAVAAYAAVVSLMDMLDQIIQHPAPQRLHLDRIQIETLREKVGFLQDFLEVHSQRFYEDLEGLARQIAAVAEEAQDIIDAHVVGKLISQSDKEVADESRDIIYSHVVDQLHEGCADKSDMDLPFSCEGIDNVIENIDSIKKELMMIKERMTIQEQGPGVSDLARSSAPLSSCNNTVVGFDEHLVRVMDELIGDKRDLQVLPIVGMGGIGKTTLARNAFDHTYVVRHFDIRAWLIISQEYSTQGILLGLLQQPVDQENKESGTSLAELGSRLHKYLYDRRYLIVLDDVWSSDVWNYIKSFFPDNKNGSRIMVTTRLLNVAVAFSSSNPYLMDFLDEDKSWYLFCEKAFGKDGCPPKLQKVGKNIARSCKGLPLAIVVIGGLLSKSNMTREYWESVAENVNSFANSENDEHCLKILSLSYNHLPIHLKPCFLYMRAFPEDHRIEVFELVRRWVAQGFLKPIKDKTLEEVAHGYLKDLTERNLILIHKWARRGKMKICGIHDLLRDLCIRESQREHFYCVPKVQRVDLYYSRIKCVLCGIRDGRTGLDLARVFVASQPTSLPSCLVCEECRIMYPQLHRLRLVKLLDLDKDILHSTKLRYLSIYGDFKFVGNLIHLLWNLQTLIITSYKQVLPSEIWELSQLRHLIIHCTVVLDPPLITQVDRKDSTIVLKNLQTLSSIKNFRWSKDAIERIPNLRILRILYYDRNKEWSYYSLHNLGRLHKLESLCLVAEALLTLNNIAFPHSLKKLTLWNCNIPWEEMMIIGSLPNLEVLKLHSFAFTGPEWNPVEGQFLRLKKLLIWTNDLVSWEAEKIHFPNLECLELHSMKYLEKIPSGIGEIEALSLIRVTFCTDSAVNSAKEILEEQHSFGYEDLQLYVDYELVIPGSS